MPVLFRKCLFNFCQTRTQGRLRVTRYIGGKLNTAELFEWLKKNEELHSEYEIKPTDHQFLECYIRNSCRSDYICVNYILDVGLTSVLVKVFE